MKILIYLFSMKNTRQMIQLKYILTILLCIGNVYIGIAQSSKKVTGRVMDAQGELLIGVNVTEVNNPSNGVVTDINGTYTINLTNEKTSLKFSYIGFKEKVISVGSKGIIDVSMEEDVAALDEVVVVGFGTQKKASVVGSITNIEPAKLAASPSRSLSNNLAGMVPGVIAVQRSGDPWFNNSDFWIRGISSFTGNTNPLVLVDGIERSLHDIDPEEIASFSVLKDAAASAVYGVRGANGVIMIETKRGKIGKPQVEVRVEQAFTAPIKMPEYIGSAKYLELINEMFIEQGRSPYASEATIENYRNHTDPELYPDINWWDVVSKDHADNTRVNLSVNGGSDILRYSLVAGFYNENGIIERDENQAWDSSLKVQRFTVRSNVDINLTPTTLFRMNIGGFLQTRNAPPGDQTNTGIFYQAMRVPPFAHPAIYADGRIPRVQYKENPWAWATQRGFEKLNHNKIESLAAIEQDLKFITPGLKAKLTFSFDKYSATSVTRAKNPDYYFPATRRDENGMLLAEIQTQGESFLGYAKGSEWGDQSLYLEGQISYNRIFNDVHDFNAMMMYNQKHYDNGDALPYRTQGIAGRFSYTYDSRYIAEFNYGFNGSENFAPGKRFGFFPAFALGWIVSEEKFMESANDIISNLKLRASWGKAGNSNIQGRRFAYISTIVDTGSYTWGTDYNTYRLGRSEGDIGVKDLTWETVTKTNFGIDLGLWNNTVNYTVDFFKENREDIFMQRTNVPGSAGFNRAVWANFGKVENKGLDMSLNVNRQLNKDWLISVMANYTYARNKVIEIDEPASIVGTYRSQTGKPVGQLFGLIAEGLFTEDDFDENGKLKEGIPHQRFSEESNLRPGDIKYRDMNGDGEITSIDATAIGGTKIPEIVYGFGATVRWKNIDLGVFFQGVGKTYNLLGGETWLPGSSLGAGNIFTNIDDRWTKDNPSQNVFWPRMSDMTVANNSQASTWWLRDMSFLRLKNLEVGYTFPEMWMNKIGIRNCRVFLRGTNLLTFSKFKLWDPELDTTDGLKYPQMKSVSVGLSINFNN